ncbi:MAG TPA: hypothetical protein VH480_02000 [Streptosporangiaceae bacterium]
MSAGTSGSRSLVARDALSSPSGRPVSRLPGGRPDARPAALPYSARPGAPPDRGLADPARPGAPAGPDLDAQPG